MPTYVYKCTQCGATKDVRHSIKELEGMSDKTLSDVKEAICESDGTDCVFVRQFAPAMPLVLNAGLNRPRLLSTLKKRSSEHYNRVIKKGNG